MSKGIGTGLIDPRYCCCAVPLVNFGIHAIIFEQAIVSLGIGIIAIATPSVVGANFPSWGPYLFAAMCFIVTACQPIGWVGVIREKTSTFKVYALSNLIAVTLAFIVGAVFVILSAVNHNAAVSQCTIDYYSATGNSTAAAFASTLNETLTIQAEKICPPLAWAQVGIMGGLWAILFVVQAYFVFLTRTYSKSQVSDHKLYHSVYSENPEAFTMSVLRSTRYNPNSVYSTPGPSGLRDDTWDARPSMESLKDYNKDYQYENQHGQYGQYGHHPSLSYGQYEHEQGQPQGGGAGYHDDAGQRGRFEDAYAEGSHAYPNTYEGYSTHESNHQAQGHGQDNGQMYGGHGGQFDQGQYDDAYHQQGYDQQYHNQHNQGYVSTPSQVYSRDPGQTPTLNQYDEGSGIGWSAKHDSLRRPDGVQSHPAEGMFGRKSPRLG